MGQCLSSDSYEGETHRAYADRWEPDRVGSGLLNPSHHQQPSQHGLVKEYITTANVGIPRSNDQYAYLHDKPKPPLKPTPAGLDPIAEDEASMLSAKQPSPVKQATPRRPAPDSSSVPLASCAPENWTQGELIGQGAFGSVYLGMDNDTGQLMAVKQVGLGRQGGGQSAAKLAIHLKNLESEVEVLQHLHHSNIVCYLGTQRTPKAFNIFLEYVPGGSIASLLAKFGSFKESVVKVYTRQILQGLEYLHANGIVHRDIKGANILVDNTGLVKLADFGASKKIEDLVTIESGLKSVKGTPYWMAPEVITATGHGRQADIWSVACTVIEMATGKPPWSQYGSQVAAMFHIAKSKGPPTIPEHLSADCKDFLYLCFNRNWRERPTAVRLMQHPFLADVVCRTVAAPMNNISGGTDVGGVGTQHAQQPQQQQIPAWRTSPEQQQQRQMRQQQRSPVARPSAQASPPPPAVPSARTAPQQPQHVGPRRQLMMDAVADDVCAAGATAAPAAPGVLPPRNLSPTRRPVVMVSAPALHGTMAAATAAARAPAAFPPANATTNAAFEAEATLVVPDPATLGSLRRSGTSAVAEEEQGGGGGERGDTRRSRNLGRVGGVRRSRSAASLSEGSVGAAPSSSSVPSTVEFSTSSGGTTNPNDDPTATVALDPSGFTYAAAGVPRSLRGSTSTDNSSGGGGRGSDGSGATTGGASSSSNASRRSERFNPMEEPAWMGGGAAAGAARQQRGGSSLSSSGASSVRSSSNIGAAVPAAGPGRPSVRGSLRSGGISCRSRRSASEGPVVYTLEGEMGDTFPEALPWDIVLNPTASLSEDSSVGGSATAAAAAAGSEWRAYSTVAPSTEPADQDVIMRALQANAMHALRASQAIFGAAARRPGSAATAASSGSNGGSSSNSENNSIGAAKTVPLPAGSSAAPPPLPPSAAPPLLSEVTSPTRAAPRRSAAGLQPSRIPRSPAKPIPPPLLNIPQGPATSPTKKGSGATVPTPLRGGVSPSKRPSASMDGSYRRKLEAQREARQDRQGPGYAARAYGGAATPVKPPTAAGDRPLRTPRRESAVKAARPVGGTTATPLRRSAA